MVKIHTLNKLKLLNYKLRISFANSRSSKHFSIVLPHLTNTHIQYKLDDKMLTQKREESRNEMEGQKSFLKISILRKTKKSKPLSNTNMKNILRLIIFLRICSNMQIEFTGVLFFEQKTIFR